MTSPLIVGIQQRKTGETICTTCGCKDLQSTIGGDWLPICEGDTHSGQHDDDPYEITVPVEFNCDRCGTVVEA